MRRLYDAGVPIILNSDDPAMFECTLTSEYDLAAREFGFSEEELDGIAGNAYRMLSRRASRSAGDMPGVLADVFARRELAAVAAEVFVDVAAIMEAVHDVGEDARCGCRPSAWPDSCRQVR